MTQITTTFGSGDMTLAGTITHPDSGPTGAAALLITGSGPINRDSDAKRLPLGVTRMLAEALADAGVSSLRFDKRGAGGSDGDFRATGFTDNVADAEAALRHLRATDGVDPGRVVVAGHSEGALIALEIAASDPSIAGAALMAGSAQTGRAVLEWQAEQVGDLLPRPVRGLMKLLRIDFIAQQRKRMDTLAASTTDVLRMQGVVKVNARWFREFMAFDPAPRLAEAKVPLLAITGSRDIQVDPEDILRMKTLTKAPFEGHVLDGVNHILRDGDPDPKRYRAQTSQPIDQRVTDLLTDWCHRVAAPLGEPTTP